MKTTRPLPLSGIEAKPGNPEVAIPTRFEISADGSEVTEPARLTAVAMLCAPASR